MRNLRCVRNAVRKIPADALPLTATAWDTSADSLICTFGPSESSAVIELKRLVDDQSTAPDAFGLIASWDAPCPLPELSCDKVLSLHYFPDSLSACLVLAGGDIVIVREEPMHGEDMIEIVGSVDAGITAAAWSPDEELLAITTRANTLLYMTRDFENVSNITFTPEDIKASNHVSVGWGKKETQFKGKRAKALRDPTMPEKVDEGLLSSLDDGSVTITWRGDGAYLAVNSVESEKRRMIRVYSREGALDSVSEPVDYLEGALSWRPAGNIIAGVQRREDRIDVVFFERNGLRHGEFSLRLTPDEMKSWGSNITLAWNTDSTVLAVCFKDRLQLWTMGNYHYYLKQEIRLSEDLSLASAVQPRWNPEKALKLALSTPYTSESLEYVFSVAGSSAVQPNDFGTVAVIDGRTLKVTPLRLANVPPPMALHEVLLEGNAVDVAINSSSTLIAVLHESEVCVYRYNISSKEAQDPILETRCTLEDSAAKPRQVTFRGDSEIFVLLDNEDIGESIVCYKTLDHEGFTMIPLDSPRIHTAMASVDYSKFCTMDEGGSVSCIDSDVLDGPSPISKFPVRPAWIEVVSHDDEDIAFGLTANGSLYANSRLLVKNCTSFRVTPAHLVFTTTQHLLKFVHLAPVEELEVPLDEPEKDERCRSIERGARLVSVMPSSYSVVLQMPRGNLETIFPRALVVAGIRKSIAEKKYKRAFMACRNQRVDMNILHDHMPEQFMASIQLFLDQLKKFTHVDLFLSQLRNEDVTQTMYKETVKKPSTGTTTNGTPANESRFDVSTKVNRICDAFLAVLQKRTETNLQNIVTANVCKTPPDLEGGLGVVAKLREQDTSLAERAAEHICFLADVNQLYDHALGMYNLDVALLIAQQSQKDPREYLPYLQSLQEMEQLRRQFTIDDNLGRRVKAIGHLYELDAFDELKAYAEKHELYSDAIALHKYKPDRLKEIMKLYARYLDSRNRFKEAGIAFEYLSDYASATEAYRAANMWRESLSCATAVPLPAEELQSLAEALAEGLTETKEFYAAATVQLDYLDDLEAAARTFCKGYFFAEAMRVVGLRRRLDLVEAVVDPGLVEGSAAMTELLADCKGQVNAQVPRLRELRVKKQEDPLAFFDGAEASGGADIPDNVSLAPTDATTSAGTFMTRYTNRSGTTLNTATTRKTSKNRRREERKRARGKKGSVYEEEYLVNSIGRLIERVNQVNEEVARLVEGLMRRGMRERAAAVEVAMEEVVALCRGCVDEVYQVEKKEVVAVTQEDGGGEEVPVAGADGVYWDAVMAERKKKEPPVVKAFERLSLVG
ncbi:Cytochrome c oxidase subunit VIIc [Lasiodiplodia theobromae]|uniref:Elongator complex protein 1 n=1 Tax=Lasiodiplodia theobromae TaxID=45133 RepID=A0A5N5D9J3_9PEZI|nr:Elongator complex protein 1 [Lasiodiplodia theobromae]KAF9637207.1 Cytochrome c oxidase subunit VIIc [Lasiodiplodia theobromae]